MEYELTHPDEVTPYYPKDASFLQREPILTYRIALGVSIGLNIYLLLKIIS